jgi:hypothetical protein
VLASWGRKAAVVGLLGYGVGLLWLGNRSVDLAVAVCLVVVGALLLLGGVGVQPLPYPLKGEIPVRWPPWRPRICSWLFTGGLLLVPVAFVTGFAELVGLGVCMLLLVGAAVLTGLGLLLAGVDALGWPDNDDTDFTSLSD